MMKLLNKKETHYRYLDSWANPVQREPSWWQKAITCHDCYYMNAHSINLDCTTYTNCEENYYVLSLREFGNSLELL